MEDDIGKAGFQTVFVTGGSLMLTAENIDLRGMIVTNFPRV